MEPWLGRYSLQEDLLRKRWPHGRRQEQAPQGQPAESGGEAHFEPGRPPIGQGTTGNAEAQGEVVPSDGAMRE